MPWARTTTAEPEGDILKADAHVGAEPGLVVIGFLRSHRETGSFDGAQPRDEVVSHAFIALGVEREGHDVVGQLVLQAGLAGADVIDVLGRVAE